VDVTRTNRALYAQLVGGWHGPLALQGGVRLDRNAAFGSFVTWRTGAVVRLSPRTRVRLAAGTAFTEPTFIENYAAGFAVGNPDLKPERARSWEAGLEHAVARGRLTLAATWFDQRFRDLIQYTFVTAQPTDPNFFNIAGANARGLELEARAAPTRAIDVTAQYTWLRTSTADSGYDGATFAPGQRLLRRPTHSGSVAAALHPSARVTGGVRVLVVGSRDDLDFSTFPGSRVRLPGYGRLDLWTDLAVVRLTGAALRLTGRVDNLTAARTTEVFGFRAPGRVVRLGLRVEAAR
jgi:vitamin B12 transporter